MYVEGYDLYRFKRSISKDLNTQSYKSYNKDKEWLAQCPERNVHADISLCHKTMPLTERQIFKKIQRNARVRNCIEDIRYFSDLVYGNPGVLNKQLTKIIEDPKQGKDFLLNIVGDPTSVSKFAGRKIFCIKSHARKRAERSVHSLCDAVEMFVGVVYALHREIVRTQAQQRNWNDLGSLERIAVQNIHHTKEKHHFALQQEPSYKVKNAVQLLI